MLKSPDSFAATNNLAKVYAALGWNDVAAEHFERAVETGDDNQGLYLKNFAQFRDSTGDWEEARELYSQLIREQPLSPTLQKSMAERFGKALAAEMAAVGIDWVFAPVLDVDSNPGNPVIGDRQYDALLRELQEIEAAHPDWVLPDSPAHHPSV